MTIPACLRNPFPLLLLLIVFLISHRSVAALPPIKKTEVNGNAAIIKAAPNNREVVSSAPAYLSLAGRIKALRQIHHYGRHRRGPDTHYGLISLGIAYLPVFLIYSAFLTGITFTGIGWGIAMLVLFLLCGIGGIYFGRKGIETDNHTWLARMGLYAGVSEVSIVLASIFFVAVFYLIPH